MNDPAHSESSTSAIVEQQAKASSMTGPTRKPHVAKAKGKTVVNSEPPRNETNADDANKENGALLFKMIGPSRRLTD